MDYSYLLGARPVETPGPMSLAAQGLTLSNLADQGMMRRFAMRQAAQQQQAQDAINRALPAVMQANWSPESIQAAVQANPQAAGPLLDMLDKKRKADADYANTNAQAAERTATANKNKVTPLANMAYGLANDPGLNTDKIAAFHKLVASSGAESLLPSVPFQDWTNPDKARPLLAMAGNAMFEAEKQATTRETGRHNATTEGMQAANYASEAERRKAETAIGYGNLGIARQGLDIKRAEADPLGVLGINPNTRGGAAGAAGSAQQGGTGDAFLQTMSKPMADQVKALAEGRMAFPAGFALKSPYWQAMISAVSQYDPSFDAINYNARVKTRSDFTAGKSAQTLNALNTVSGHLDDLSKAADALNNFGGVGTLLNAPVNAMQSATGDPRLKNFNIARKVVADEMTRAYRAAGGSEKDIQEWMSLLNANGSPEQMNANIAQVSKLLESKISAMGSQYEQGMGTSSQPIQLITPKARAVFDKLEARAGGAPASGGVLRPNPDGSLDYVPR
jgi:hypothetical protein